MRKRVCICRKCDFFHICKQCRTQNLFKSGYPSSTFQIIWLDQMFVASAGYVSTLTKGFPDCSYLNLHLSVKTCVFKNDPSINVQSLRRHTNLVINTVNSSWYFYWYFFFSVCFSTAVSKRSFYGSCVVSALLYLTLRHDYCQATSDLKMVVQLNPRLHMFSQYKVQISLHLSKLKCFEKPRNSPRINL